MSYARTEELKLLVNQLCIAKEELINHLNAKYEKIENETRLIPKVLLQIDWFEDKREYTERLSYIGTDIRQLMQCDINDSSSGSTVHQLSSTPTEDQVLLPEQLDAELYTPTLCMIPEGFVLES
jgi:hypothetical protein